MVDSNLEDHTESSKGIKSDGMNVMKPNKDRKCNEGF